MTSTRILDLLEAMVRAPLGAFWAAVAWLLDQLRGLGPVWSGILALLAVAASVGLAWFLQRRLRQRLGSPPAGSAGDRQREPHRLSTGEIVRLELGHSFLVLPVKPFQLVGRGLKALGRGLGRLFRRRKEDATGKAGTPGRTDTSKTGPSMVATLGPSFLLGGVVTAGLYLALRLSAPLVAARLGLSEGLSPWQWMVFGQRPELAWYLPLERFPYLAGLLAVLFWLGVWSLAAVAVRGLHWRHLRRDLASTGEDGRDEALRDRPDVLPFWRRRAGATELWRPDRSYRRWAAWPVALAVPLVAWGWVSLGGDPYRMGPSELAVALVLWTAWATHLLLEGKKPGTAAKAEESDDDSESLDGWEEVLAYLAGHNHVKEPVPFERWRLAPAPREPIMKDGSRPKDDPRLISPLVGQLLGKNGRPGAGERRDQHGPGLSRMQREVLEALSLQGYVHTDPPRPPGSFALGREAQEPVEDRSGLRSRNLVVLAPEGAGKSTLGLLAVANHALVHTRGSLVVVADDDRAETLARGYRRALDVTPLRWSVRVRSPGDDLLTDLSRGIVPDVVVTGLRDLVVTLLDRSDSFEPFLRNLGLLVIDDVEAFTGPREVHGQLAFRRLVHRLEELLEVEELGGRDLAAPQVLILGTDAMHDTSEWARTLCGIDAVLRPYPEEPANGDGSRAPADGGDPTPPGVEQRRYRLRDFRTDSGDLVSLETLIEACEAREVPWHYRSCGDGRRDRGRLPLLLSEEPRRHIDDAEKACVVFLEGSWSEVEREIRRLRRAGTAFARRRSDLGLGDDPEPVGLVTVADPDVEMAFTQLDREFVLAPTLVSLPRPVFRPPTGRAVEPHLAADLTQHWTEVGDVTRIFGDATAGLLRKLARQNLLQAEDRTDVEPKVNEYVRRVHVRALARAVRGEEEKEGGRGPTRALLPPRVGQVELVAPEATVAVRDRASLLTLARIDAASAPFTYYPGRIFRDARGTFVVVGRASEEVERRSGADVDEGAVVRKGDVLVEPILTDAVSSPRRRFAVEPLEEDGRQELCQSAGGAFLPMGRVLLGREPIGLALGPVAIRVDHVATYRLGPVYSEVRQRSLEPKGRSGADPVELETVALHVVPNPEPEEEPSRNGTAGGSERPQPPRLGPNEARLLAAAMRAVLPSMYRGGGESVGVALVMGEPPTETEADAATDEGDPQAAEEAAEADATELESAADEAPPIDLYLFDTDAGGNGTARAVYRDGVALLLRLCRLLVERVLSLDRLLALYDEWGDEEEILEEARAEAGGGKRAEEVADERREAHETLRHSLLEWLDSRLPPEGGPESQRELARYFRSGSEAGEGDVIDLGRCWYSADDTVTDLLWAKHRWQHPDLGEVMLDVGFDRGTYLQARSLREALLQDPEQSKRLYMAAVERHGRDTLQVPRCQPQGVRFVDPTSGAERSSDIDFTELQKAATALWALGAATSSPLSELVRFLRGEARERRERAAVLITFVQGIPNSPARLIPEPGEGIDIRGIRSPIECLLERRADALSKALLLAVLFSRAECGAGLFLSLEGRGKAFGAVSTTCLPAAAQRLEKPSFWARVSPRKDGTEGSAEHFYPVDLRAAGPVGRIHVEEDELDSWVFVPLLHLAPPMPATEETGPEGAPGLEVSDDGPDAPAEEPAPSRASEVDGASESSEETTNA